MATSANISQKDLAGMLPIQELINRNTKRIEDFLYSGDPVLRQWFLIRNDFLPFILCLSYVVMTQIGLHIMRNREPFDLRKPMIIFNFTLVAVYITALSMITYYLPKLSWEKFCKGGLITRKDPSYMLATIAWVGYIVRYIEFFDTAFFILRKKENLVSFLHVFHHAVVPFLGWILFRTEKSALQAIPVLLNSFIHVIMYTYYGLAAMGPKFRKYLWWKKYLTQLQIIQFVFVIFFVIVIAPYTGCDMVATTYLMDIIFGPIFLFLFYRFYKTRFKPRMQKIE